MTTTKREFIVKTPLGNLRIQAKHSGDYPDDYPGIYIDLMLDNGEYEMLTCVEYNSCRNHIQTCVYDPGCDDPTDIIVHHIEV